MMLLYMSAPKMGKRMGSKKRGFAAALITTTVTVLAATWNSIPGHTTRALPAC